MQVGTHMHVTHIHQASVPLDENLCLRKPARRDLNSLVYGFIALQL